MRRFVWFILLTLISSAVFGQSNTLLDAFLAQETADVATTLLLVGQASGELPLDAAGNAGYEWASAHEQFGKHVLKVTPEDPIGLGLFYLVLLKSFGIEGGMSFNGIGSPRYAALEAGYRGYIEPTQLYTDRTMAPWEVLTGISYVTEDTAGGES